MTTREEFIERVEKWSKKIQVEYNEIQFRKMIRKWSSCSSRGRLTFDPNILDKNIDFQDEVIVHELLHLRYPNHGKMFKQMLAFYIKKEN
ncbi:MAG: M48 family metallopeptidase [Candidatus Heimdallarchaeota archaeon]|nr:M48 family metallopeptidase [Candidatus Heimdallarchaeota archaeon]